MSIHLSVKTHESLWLGSTSHGSSSIRDSELLIASDYDCRTLLDTYVDLEAARIVWQLPPRWVYREFPKEGIYKGKKRKNMSTPFRHKIDQHGLKTTLNCVGKASRGIGQLIAPFSSNMSPWGLMADPSTPIFINFRTFSENQDRNFGNSFQTNEFLVAPLAKLIGGKWSYVDPLL